GGLAIATETAIGGAFTLAIVENDVEAIALGDNTIQAAGNITLEAATHGDIAAVAIGIAGVLDTGRESSGGEGEGGGGGGGGGGKSTDFTGAGSGAGTGVDNSTLAEIRSGGAITAGGAVALAAADDTSLSVDAGGAAIAISTEDGGNPVAVGVSIAVN